MTFNISSTKLLKQLQMLSGVIQSSNTLPILDNILFEIEDNSITLTGSDLETTLTTKVEANTKETGTVCIPAKILLDTLKTFPEQPLTFTVDPTSYAIEIASDFGKYKLNGYDGAEFPKTPSIEGASEVKLSADTLSRAITKTIFATGNDDLRPVMSGIYFDFKDDGLTFVATDAHKLVRYTRTDIKASGNSSFIAPKKPLNLMKNILASTDADVTVTYNEATAQFSFDNISITCRLIDGKYPNYQAVIPTENPNKLTVGREALMQSIKRVSVFANKTTHQVKLQMTGNELAIFAEDIDFANAANEKMTCAYEGNDMEIGFNSRFIADILSNLETDDVLVEMSAPNRAGIILPTSKDLEEEDVLMLVMPVMLNG